MQSAISSHVLAFKVSQMETIATIYRDESGRWITELESGAAYVSDERGNPLRDDEGFVTYVGDFGL